MKRPLSQHDEAHNLRMAIGRLARAAAAPGWSRLVVRHAQVGTYATTTITRDGSGITADGLDEPFRRLRELSYRPRAGTWFSCELVFTSGGRGYTGRVDSAEPPFADVPPAAALLELTSFPREDTPGWLLAALPTAPPIALPTSYAYRRHHHPGERPPPPPPISGELAYRPDSTMIARTFVHQEKRGQRMACLTVQEGDPEAGHLLVMCHDDQYWLIRDGRPAPHRGLRSITLDGGALRLELTPEAADALGTESGFEVRLDLPAGTTAELGAALTGMMRPVADPPDLIGF